MAGIWSSGTISTRRQRIAQLAREKPSAVLTTLAHHIDLAWLHEAHKETRKDGALGVDGKTAADFEENLLENLMSLLKQAKSGTYRAPPVRRVLIPKGSGDEMRPIGIPTYSDKVLQRAVVMVLECVYEQDFLDCSYGFRPGRSAHQAIEAVRNQTMDLGCTMILEIDIRKFFDSVDHKHVQEIVRKRVGDGVLLRLIGKWLNAGVQQDEMLTHPETGTPQGGVVSPMLANIFLHEVLDTWFEHEVKPRLKGRSFLVRYADDAVLGFSDPEDARRVLEVLPQRLSKFGLTLHPAKTRLVAFARPPRKGGGPTKRSGPGTFDFLGFTFHWGRSRKGSWVVRQKTAKSRLARAIQRAADWCRANRHWKIKEQYAALAAKLRGHYEYYGVTGNHRALSRFRNAVERNWQEWLSRRSQHRGAPWSWFAKVKTRYSLPTPRIAHSYVT